MDKTTINCRSIALFKGNKNRCDTTTIHGTDIGIRIPTLTVPRSREQYFKSVHAASANTAFYLKNSQYISTDDAASRKKEMDKLTIHIYITKKRGDLIYLEVNNTEGEMQLAKGSNLD